MTAVDSYGFIDRFVWMNDDFNVFRFFIIKFDFYMFLFFFTHEEILLYSARSRLFDWCLFKRSMWTVLVLKGSAIAQINAIFMYLYESIKTLSAKNLLYISMQYRCEAKCLWPNVDYGLKY